NEEILASILLATTGRSRRVGDRKLETHHLRAQLVDEGRLPGAGESREVVDVRHSTFCTCSRDFSISDFMMRPISVIFSASPARPEVFESSVWASRFISCSRNSSFLPIPPFSWSKPMKCWMWVC